MHSSRYSVSLMWRQWASLHIKKVQKKKEKKIALKGKWPWLCSKGSFGEQVTLDLHFEG